MISRNQEKTLVNKILARDEKSLRRFYNYYSPRLQAFIKKKLNTAEDAEEILQDTFLDSLESLRDFTFRSSLNTFLHAIARNKIIDYYRKKKLKRILFSQLPQLESILSSLGTPEEALENKQARLNLDKAFKKLKPTYRQILTLKYFEGKSVLQITRELKLTFKGAESMLFRARRAFAETLKVV